MSIAWRRLLAWTLALWLPLHGAAAVAMGLCAAMPLQHAAAVERAAVLAPTTASGALEAHRAHCAEGAAAAADPAAVAVAGESPSDDGGACAHCAACQVQVAALPAVPLLQHALLPGTWVHADSSAPPERAPESLERPPRPARA